MNQIFYFLEQHFFLNISVKFGLDVEQTTKIIKEMHITISTGKRMLSDYSDKLQDYYNYYLDFLKIL